jgi:2,3-bisphosphoglycerate-independent phosphoglycerate mutase
LILFEGLEILYLCFIDEQKKVILMILDGWGKSPDPKVSAIDNANIPFIKVFIKLKCSTSDGLNVGLPEGQMGNSEVGHMNGAGRIVYQDLAKINLAVNKTLAEEQVLKDAFQYAMDNNKKSTFFRISF